MYDTAKRVELVKKRGRQLRRKRERQGVYRMLALSTVLCVSLIGAIGTTTGLGEPAIHGMYGSMLLRENVGGYVLVGVITFAVAVVITVLCIRYKEKTDHHDQRDTGEDHDA